MSTQSPQDVERDALTAWDQASKATDRAAFMAALSVASWAKSNPGVLPSDVAADLALFNDRRAVTIAANQAWIAARDAAKAVSA